MGRGMTDQRIDWTEDDSAEFAEMADFFVPERDTQHDIITQLLVPGCGSGEILDLGAGDGALAHRLLSSLPGCRLHLYDRSSAMLARCDARLRAFSRRVRRRQVELAAEEWRRELPRLYAVTSSLAVHHLSGPQKRRLFQDMHASLTPGGQLILADIVEPVNERGRSLARRAWDEWVEQRCREATRPEVLATFREEGWNYYAQVRSSGSVDQPSPLLDQLLWLREAGFEDVDVYWMKAGHALFGGAKRGAACRGA